MKVIKPHHPRGYCGFFKHGDNRASDWRCRMKGFGFSLYYQNSFMIVWIGTWRGSSGNFGDHV